MTPMRTAESWTDNKSLAVWVRAIQADARRSAIEECVDICNALILAEDMERDDPEVVYGLVVCRNKLMDHTP